MRRWTRDTLRVSVRKAWFGLEESTTNDDVCLILLFSGVAPPPSWHSPWMLCRVGWPLAAACGLAIDAVWVITREFENHPAVAYYIDIPGILKFVTALGCYWWLWDKAHRLIAEDVPLPPEQLSVVVRWVSWYIAVWMVTGIAVCVWLAYDGHVFEVIPVSSVYSPSLYWLILIPTAPVLGATLLVLGIETAHASNTIEALLQAARDKSLTRSMYTTARDSIDVRSKFWGKSLGLLAAVALYNTIGLIAILHSPKLDPYIGNAIAEDFYHVVNSGKEVALLFAILALAVQVNVRADALATVLHSAPWGEPGSKEESRRQDLLWLSTSHLVAPSAADSVWAFFMAADSKPITFQVCGIRPTRDLLRAAVVSLVGGVGGSLLRSYTMA